jgi:hypothetical protein
MINDTLKILTEFGEETFIFPPPLVMLDATFNIASKNSSKQSIKVTQSGITKNK